MQPNSQRAEQLREKFGEAIRVRRKRRGLNQIDAARAMGVDYRHYQNLETGKINMRLDTFFHLAKFYDLDVNLVEGQTREIIDPAAATLP